MKKILCLLLAMVLCTLSACTINEGTQNNKTDDKSTANKSQNSADFEYVVRSYGNRTAAIVGYKGSSKKITIPDEIDGYKIIEIFNLEGAKNVEKINIPESVTSVKSSAFEKTKFYNNSNNWDQGVLYCDSYLIKAASFEEKIVVADGTKYIAGSAFEELELEEVVIPDSVLSIGDHAFYECEDLRKVTLGKNLVHIGDLAFADCEDIEEINFPDSLTVIENDAFEWDVITSLTSFGDNGGLYLGNCLIRVDDDREGEFRVKEGTLGISDGAFDGCEDITSLVIPNSVIYLANLGGSAYCGIKSITLGNNIKYIDSYAFAFLDDLEYVSNIPKSVEYFGKCPTTKSKINSITFDKDNKYFCSDENGFVWTADKKVLISAPKNLPEEYTVPDFVSVIEDGAFSDCYLLKKIHIPSGITAIDQGAFLNCDNLTDIYFAGSQEEWDTFELIIEEDVSIHFNS